MQLTDYQKLWHPCPDCGATRTILNTEGSKYPGIWECINPECGASDVCLHDPNHYEIAEIEHISSNPNSSYYWTERVYVCGDCDATIDSDIADPEIDAQEAQIDEQIDMARGK